MEMDVLRLNHRTGTGFDDDDDDDADDSDVERSSSSVMESSPTGELAGIYLGVLNVYTTLPQFVGTFISWIVFSVLEPGPGTPSSNGQVSSKEATVSEGIKRHLQARDGGWMNLDTEAPNAIAVCLFIGGLSALVAAEATRRFRALK